MYILLVNYRNGKRNNEVFVFFLGRLWSFEVFILFNDWRFFYMFFCGKFSFVLKCERGVGIRI